jgi:hypothetical protein
VRKKPVNSAENVLRFISDDPLVPPNYRNSGGIIFGALSILSRYARFAASQSQESPLFSLLLSDRVDPH